MSFLRNTWYVAAWSGEVGRTCLARKILGEPVMLYRTAAGKPVALLDRCPHRLLPLSLGTLQGDTIECGYHGLTFDSTEHVTERAAVLIETIQKVTVADIDHDDCRHEQHQPPSARFLRFAIRFHELPSSADPHHQRR